MTERQEYFQDVADRVFRQLFRIPDHTNVWDGICEGPFVRGISATELAEEILASVPYRRK